MSQDTLYDSARRRLRRPRAGPAALRSPGQEDLLARRRLTDRIAWADRKQGRFICYSLNGAHEFIAIRVVSVGLVNRTVVHPNN
jgi:hypothetical protein